MVVGLADKIKLDGENFKLAFDWIKNTDLDKLEAGTYEIKGRDVYAMIQLYDSFDSSERRFESHKKYADVQMVVRGMEKMLVIEGVDNLGPVVEPYNEEKDITFYSSDIAKASEIEMSERLAVVLFPEDGHMPCIRYEESESIKKLVVKVRL